MAVYDNSNKSVVHECTDDPERLGQGPLKENEMN